MIEKYNYLKDDIRPGEKFNAKKQCQQSFDKSFIPHVTNISPFEVTINIIVYCLLYPSNKINFMVKIYVFCLQSMSITKSSNIILCFYSFEIDVNAIKNMALMKFFILIISHKLSHTFINVATLITDKPIS